MKKVDWKLVKRVIFWVFYVPKILTATTEKSEKSRIVSYFSGGLIGILASITLGFLNLYWIAIVIGLIAYILGAITYGIPEKHPEKDTYLNVLAFYFAFVIAVLVVLIVHFLN